MYFVQLCRQLWLAILHTGHCHIVFERMIIATVNLQGRWTDAADHAPRGPAARRRRAVARPAARVEHVATELRPCGVFPSYGGREVLAGRDRACR